MCAVSAERHPDADAMCWDHVDAIPPSGRMSAFDSAASIWHASTASEGG